jgi:hypothetical protein
MIQALTAGMCSSAVKDTNAESENAERLPSEYEKTEVSILLPWSSTVADIGKANVRPNSPASIDAGIHIPTDNVNFLAEMRSSAGEGRDPASRIADQWLSASDDDDKSSPNPADDWSSASDTNNNDRQVADNWESATEPHSSFASGQTTVTPSRFTIDTSRSTFSLPDAWPCPNNDDRARRSQSTLAVPEPSPFRHYGPEHFQFLEDNMFEDDSSSDDFE